MSGVVRSVLLACALAPCLAGAQQVYKWTDSQGQVHYSDHAESGQSTSTVNVPKTPPKPAAAPVETEIYEAQEPRHEPIEPHTTDPVVVRNAEDRTRREMAAKQKAADQTLVAKCKANRDSFCNDVGEIKRQQQVLNAPQPVRKGIVPPSTRPPPAPQPFWQGNKLVTPVKKPTRKSDDE